MRSCYQFQDMNILEHGESVALYFRDLHGHLFQNKAIEQEWRLPDWLTSPDFLSLIKGKLLDFDLLQTYQIYHDCGKPLCRTVDEEGRQHFPYHAEVSAKRWWECADGSPEALQIARLIGMDMDIHLLKAEGLEEFCRRPEAISLLLTGLCEIHSNARMFGGIESTSFKIKWKNLDKMGRRILTKLHTDKPTEGLSG
jgi:hypothetical protein